MTSKPGRVIGLGRAEGEPVYCFSGVRHEGGVSSVQALVRNVGTCRPDAKEETQVKIRKGQSTEVGHRGGVTRSSDEASVMDAERRGYIVQLLFAGQPEMGGASE